MNKTSKHKSGKTRSADRAGHDTRSSNQATASRSEAAKKKIPAKTSASARSRSNANDRFLIVGIGASAGGLEAMQELFEAMPMDTGMAFVIITHQHPGHASMLPDLLSRTTGLPVVQGGDGMKLEPDHVYVGPPSGYLDLLRGRLHQLEGDIPEPVRLPIDHFFRSLAQDQGEKAICIVLSGTGTDGTLGLKAIKGASGMAMVQQVQSAKYAGMPSSAVATGLADYILKPADMPTQLVKYARGPYLAAPVNAEAQQNQELQSEPLQKIFILLRSRTGHDFSGYKVSTILRIPMKMTGVSD